MSRNTVLLVPATTNNGKSVEAGMRPNGTSPGNEYFENLSLMDKAKFTKLFELMAERGHIFNTEQFRLLEDGIFEFKAKGHRLLCFFSGDKKIILTNGLAKNSKKDIRSAIEVSKNIREAYLTGELI